MPNWCDNNLYISHPDPKMMEKALNAWNEGKLLSTLVPEPDYSVTPVPKMFPQIDAEYAKTEEDKAKALANAPTIREDAWWDWRIQNWGTKWDIGWDDSQDKAELSSPTSMFVWFQSAWSPPTGAYEKMEELGFEIKAYYYEGGCAFAGRFDECGDDCYSLDFEEGVPAVEWLEKNIPRDILDEMDMISQYIDWEDFNG